MQHRPQQAMQGQFPPVSGPSPSQGPCYPQMTVCPIGQPSPPVYVVRAPTASMTGMPQFETHKPPALERKIIQIKDAEQSASSRTSPLSSQQQAEANVRAEFAAQVASTLAKDSKSEDSEMEQYRPEQATQGQFTPLVANAAPVVRAPTAPMTGLPQFQTQNVESRALERKIIQLKDPEQSACSRTSPLSSQHQAEAWIEFVPPRTAAIALGTPVTFAAAAIGMEQFILQQATMNRTGLC